MPHLFQLLLWATPAAFPGACSAVEVGSSFASLPPSSPSSASNAAHIAIVENFEAHDELSEAEADRPSSARKAKRQPKAKKDYAAANVADSREAAVAAMEERHLRQDRSARHWLGTVCRGC
jgi:hypothetical protein